MLAIPISVSAGIAGFESPAAEYKDLDLMLDQILIERRSSTFIARASGVSMQGFGIFDQDILIIDRAAPKSAFDIIVAVLEGQLVVKAIDRKKGILISGHPEYRPINVSNSESFLEEGIVIRSVRLHREPPLLTRVLR